MPLRIPRQLAYALTCLLIAAVALAQDTITPAPSSPAPTGVGILRPSSAETITVGTPYTIRWSKPPANSGPLAIELFGNVGAIYALGPNDTSCDGWLINTECDKFDVEIPAGATSYVWNLTKPYDYWRLLYEELSFTLGVYEDNLDFGELPKTDAPWYWSAEFTLAREETSTTTRTTTTTTTTSDSSTSRSATGTDGSSMPTASSTGELDEVEASSTTDGGAATDTPTDDAARLTVGWKVGIFLVAAWAFIGMELC